jgi:hypothetical protein
LCQKLDYQRRKQQQLKGIEVVDSHPHLVATIGAAAPYESAVAVVVMSSKRKNINNDNGKVVGPAARRPRKQTTIIERGNPAAVQPELKLLIAAVKDCSPPARSLTALKLCDLREKYKDFDHRLPCLAHAATCKDQL